MKKAETPVINVSGRLSQGLDNLFTLNGNTFDQGIYLPVIYTLRDKVDPLMRVTKRPKIKDLEQSSGGKKKREVVVGNTIVRRAHGIPFLNSVLELSQKTDNESSDANAGKIRITLRRVSGNVLSVKHSQLVDSIPVENKSKRISAPKVIQNRVLYQAGFGA